MTKPKPLERRAAGGFRRWHAKIGLVAAAFFLFLAVTGLMLNHTEPLGLDSRHITNSLLTGWYGIRREIPAQGYLLGEDYFVADTQKWWYGGKVIAEREAPPVGAVALGDIRYVATPHVLFLYQKDGRQVDKIDQAALPAWPIERLGWIGEAIVLSTKRGQFVSNDGINWRAGGAEPVKWAEAVVLPEPIRQSLGKSFAPSLLLERVVLDLHSGRLFGHFGPLVMDLMAIALIVLAGTGVWIYVKAARQRRRATVMQGSERAK